IVRAQVFNCNVHIFPRVETRRMPETGRIAVPNRPADFKRHAQILHMPAWVQQSDQLDVVRSRATAPDGPLTINAPMAVAHYHFLVLAIYVCAVIERLVELRTEYAAKRRVRDRRNHVCGWTKADRDDSNWMRSWLWSRSL
ncbi:MAG TPA: hypothetical protein VFO40_00780, partial [Chthoniobacterales bacterium]|nr:hypothetical protein [Chthoniobacterales bacterium]